VDKWDADQRSDGNVIEVGVTGLKMAMTSLTEKGVLLLMPSAADSTCNIVDLTCDITDLSCDIANSTCNIVDSTCDIVDSTCDVADSTCDVADSTCDVVGGISPSYIESSINPEFSNVPIQIVTLFLKFYHVIRLFQKEHEFPCI
jgi:hypothetical protein